MTQFLSIFALQSKLLADVVFEHFNQLYSMYNINMLNFTSMRRTAASAGSSESLQTDHVELRGMMGETCLCLRLY